MKKLMLFAALLGFAVACGGNEKKEEPKKNEAAVEAPAKQDATDEAPEAEEVVANKATAEATVVGNTIQAEVTEIDHSKGMTATDIDINQVDLATATKDNTGAKKGNQLHVGGATKELNKSANAQVGAGLNTTKLEVVK
ncbi:MAG: hypothetical protein E7135_00605 [Rikenellaceae bacterium]|nr:hypothetical protein [Rikenellaceae bacterium]